MNSRAKGTRGERQWRDELRANGYEARRGQQFSGSPESPDVVCAALPWAHFEVKAVERLNIEDAMEQARKDCSARSHLTPALSPEGGEGESRASGKVPVVAHKRNHRRWLVTMEAETFFRLVRGDFQTRRHTNSEEGGDRNGRERSALTLAPSPPGEGEGVTGGPEDYLGCGDGRGQ